MQITFKAKSERSKEFPPLPARSLIPHWISKLKPVIHDVKSIKSCPAVMDYLVSGYFLRACQDYTFERSVKENKEYIIINGILEPRSPVDEGLHSMLAFEDHIQDQCGIKKTLWILDPEWSWSTPPEYSTLILPNFYSFAYHQAFPTIIDTDKFNLENTNIGFITTLQDQSSYSWTIKKGEPLALIIPFKRDEWSHSIEEYQTTDQSDYSKDYRSRKKFN